MASNPRHLAPVGATIDGHAAAPEGQAQKSRTAASNCLGFLSSRPSSVVLAQRTAVLEVDMITPRELQPNQLPGDAVAFDKVTRLDHGGMTPFEIVNRQPPSIEGGDKRKSKVEGKGLYLHPPYVSVGPTYTYNTNSASDSSAQQQSQSATGAAKGFVKVPTGTAVTVGGGAGALCGLFKSKASAQHSASFTAEIPVLAVHLDLPKLKLSRVFVQRALRELPTVINEVDKQAKLDAMQSFVEDMGPYFVSTIFLGGRAMGQMKTSKSAKVKDQELESKGTAELNAVLAEADITGSGRYESRGSSESSMQISNTLLEGGCETGPYQFNSLADVKSWVQSLTKPEAGLVVVRSQESLIALPQLLNLALQVYDAETDNNIQHTVLLNDEQYHKLDEQHRLLQKYWKDISEKAIKEATAAVPPQVNYAGPCNSQEIVITNKSLGPVTIGLDWQGCSKMQLTNVTYKFGFTASSVKADFQTIERPVLHTEVVVLQPHQRYVFPAPSKSATAYASATSGQHQQLFANKPMQQGHAYDVVSTATC